MSNGDPYVAVADELSQLGSRLDGLGARLRELRASTGSVEPATAPEAARSSRPRDAWLGTGVASEAGPVRPGPPAAADPGPPAGAATAPSAPLAGTQPQVGAPRGPEVGPPRREQPHPGSGTRPGDHVGTGEAPYPGPQAHRWGPPPAGYPGAPGGGGAPAVPSAGPGGPAPRPRSRALSALSGARLLAWTGGAVTLLGVVLLLVLAASRGWFSPGARVGAGALLGVALVAVGVWLHRRESARTGALALAATGFATLYLVVAAATSLYAYLAEVPALLVALLVAAAGLGLADRWRSQLLGVGATAGAAVLAPVLVWDWLLVALVLALQLAALPVVVRRRWPVLMLVAAAGPLLLGSAVGVGEVAFGATGTGPTIAAVLGTLAVALATAAPAAALLPPRPVAVLVAGSAVPVLATAAALGGWGGGALALVAAVALAVVAALPGADRAIRTVAATAAALALFQATLVALDGSTATAVVLGQAIVGAAAAAALRTRFPLVVAMLYGLYGVLLAFTEDAPPPVELPYAAAGPLAGTVLTAAGISSLVLVLAVALLVAGGRVGLIRPDAGSARLWVPIGLIGLYGEATLVVALALLVSPDRTGFTAGHALVTVSWAVVALVLLARGISRTALRITGMVLVAAAVAKLVLFDLVALDGIARVAAFLGAGLVLLAAGTRYARLVAETGTAPGADPAPAPPPSPSG